MDDVAGMELDHACPTIGPGNRYRFALFIEKEGFNPLLEKARIAERYDLAIMSTKGMSTTACRQLVEELTEAGVTILVLHDFDKAGFSIANTLRSDTRRYHYSVAPNVIDLGLRLTDVQEMRLQSEAVDYDSSIDTRVNLRESGATKKECSFLVREKLTDEDGDVCGWRGERVELNAMTSPQFRDWLEAKLTAQSVQKVVPDHETLAKAYRRAARRVAVQHAINPVIEQLRQDDEISVPSDLPERIRQAVTGTDQPWDAAVWQLANSGETAGTPSATRPGNIAASPC